MEVTKETVTVYDNGADERGKPAGTGVVYKNQVPVLSRKTGIQMEFSEIFGKFCDNYDFPADSQQTSFLDSK